jgi:hypothetical protein
MRVMCIKDVYHKSRYDEEMCYFDSGKVYEVNEVYDYGISVYVTFNDPPSSFMFYYDNASIAFNTKYMGLIYKDYFISIEDYRDKILNELI